MRIAVRNDQHIACCEGHFLSVLSVAETHDGVAICHQVIADQALRSRCQQMRVFAQRRHRDSPRARAYPLVEYRARHAYRIDSLGPSIHGHSAEEPVVVSLQGTPAFRHTNSELPRVTPYYLSVPALCQASMCPYGEIS